MLAMGPVRREQTITDATVLVQPVKQLQEPLQMLIFQLPVWSAPAEARLPQPRLINAMRPSIALPTPARLLPTIGAALPDPLPVPIPAKCQVLPGMLQMVTLLMKPKPAKWVLLAPRLCRALPFTVILPRPTITTVSIPLTIGPAAGQAPVGQTIPVQLRPKQPAQLVMRQQERQAVRP